MSGTLLSIANGALLQQQFEKAIRLYAEILRRQPLLRAHAAFNLSLARRRHRAARRNERRSVGICGQAAPCDAITSRVIALAGLYRKFARVETVDTSFPKAGGALARPICDLGVPGSFVRAETMRDFLPSALEFVLSHPHDIVHLCEPNLPNLVLGSLYKAIWDSRVIVDLDGEYRDCENVDGPYDYAACSTELPRAPLDMNSTRWRRQAFDLHQIFDGVTTSSEALQARYGGTIVPNTRDETLFRPSAELKAATRKRFGVPVEQTVVLLFSTSGRRKNLQHMLRSLTTLRRGDICCVIIERSPDPALREVLSSVASLDYFFIEAPPHDDMVEVISMGDICILVQEDDPKVAEYRVPAELTDVLAMEMLTLAQPTAALSKFIDHGVVIPARGETLANTISTSRANRCKSAALRAAGRRFFLQSLSVSACLPTFREMALSSSGYAPHLSSDASLTSRHASLIDEFGGWDAFRHVATPVKPKEKLVADDRPIVVYSVVVGDETVKEPATLDPNVRYILFTNNATLEAEKWEVVLFDTMGLSPGRASRLPQILPHQYLPRHEVSVFIDADLTLIEHDVMAMTKECLQGYDVAAYSHRECAYAEIDERVGTGKADQALAKKFLERLRKEKFPRKYGLLENRFLVRRDTRISRRINELWLREYIDGAECDLFYLTYVLWRADIPYSTIGTSANLADSPYVLFNEHRGAAATERSPAGTVPREKFGILTKRDAAALERLCEDALATPVDLDATRPSLFNVKRKEHEVSYFSSLISAIVELQSQALPSAQRYRGALSHRLFPMSPARRHSLGRTRIGYVTNSAMPTIAANNVHVMKMCAALAGAKADVVLYAQRAQVDVIPGDHYAIYKAFGVRHQFPIRFLEKNRSNSKYGLYRLVRRAIADGCTHIYTRSLSAAVFAAIADVPTILELHKVVAPEEIHEFEYLVRSPAFNKLVVISKPLIALFKKYSVGIEHNTVVLHDGADPVTEPVEPFRLHRSLSAKLHIGYVGHLYPGKGAEISFELARRMPHVDFHMLGGTPDDIHHWKQRSAGVPNIKFYGHRPHEDVASFIEAVDIVIAPFLREVMASGNKYNIADFFSPLKIFEYMAHGKAIVASDLPVLREVLKHRENALLCDPESIESFIAAIEELRNGSTLRAQLGSTARRVFEAKYTWSARATRILSMLRHAYTLECGTKRATFQGLVDGARRKPLVKWYYGGRKQEGWAYGINARRLSSRISSCSHIVTGGTIPETEDVDVAVAFDVLIMDGETFRTNKARKKILRVGGPNPLSVFSGGKRERLSAALTEADAIIALSPQLRDELRTLHPAVYFIPNGIDLEYFHPRRRRRTTGPFTVGMSASVVKEDQRLIKGYYLAELACEMAGVDFLAVGRGGNHIPHDRLIEDFYSKIDVLVHPVDRGKEASSNVIMEALALGIPVVTTRYAGFHGVALRDGVEALLARRTAGDFARTLSQLRQDAELRTRLARSGRAFVERHHPIDLIASKYELVIWSCLTEQPEALGALSEEAYA